MHQLIPDTPQLTRFISHIPKFKGHEKAYVDITDSLVSVSLPRTVNRTLCLGISYDDLDLRLSSLEQICGSLFPRALIQTTECLYIKNSWSVVSHWRRDIVDSDRWLDILRPFSAVKYLYISWEFAPGIARALQELVGTRATEVLPTLQTLFLEEADLSGPVWEAIGRFVAARQVASHPIAVSSWKSSKRF
jgi:hypothetical protein